MSLAVLLYVATIALIAFWITRPLLSRRPRFPPGPAQSWLSGNLRDLPKEQSWRTYEKWGKRYGPIIHIRIFSRHLMILNSATAATELLDKRANIYSNRPVTTMTTKIIDRGDSPFFAAPTNPKFQVYRRMFHRTLGPKPLRAHTPVQEHHAQVFLKNLLMDPDNVDAHIRKNAAAVIMRIAYGYNVHPTKRDPFVEGAEEAMEIGGILTKPGRWLVDGVPLLRYIPAWLPGGAFHREGKVYSDLLTNIYASPVRLVKEQMITGTALPSFTSQQLSSNDFKVPEAELEQMIVDAAGALFVGAADTTLSALVSFFYNMMVCPAVQRRAHKEIDRVVGRDRLPNMADKESLPYIDLLIMELLRWCPPAPLALPHQVMRDDEYAGYDIPAGATVIPNLWAIMHDERVYPEPMKFDPDRFSTDNGHVPQENPRRWVWGFGRRVCPGQYLAETALFINIASALAVFNIRKPVDDNGLEIEPVLDFTTGTTTRVQPFQCRITPRQECAGLVAHLEGWGMAE